MSVIKMDIFMIFFTLNLMPQTPISLT